MNNVFKSLLIVCAIFLGWLCYISIMNPIEFKEQKDIRDKVVVKRLIEIRRAQIEYRDQKGNYTSDWDSLIYFINTAQEKIVMKEGELTDKQLEEGMTEKKAVKQGLIKRDTTFISLKTSLFGADYPTEEMRIIPFSKQEEFIMEAATITSGSAGIEVKVVEVKAPYTSYLHDLNKQELVNLVDITEQVEKFPGLKFGDIQQANNNAGNWE